MVGKRHKNRHHRHSPILQHLGEEPVFRQYALDMQNCAVSWRGYRVGGSGVGVTKDGRYVPLSGFNTKAAPGPRRQGDLCAEMRIIKDAERKHCVAILEMWMAQPPQPDDFTKLDLGVAVSCGHCRLNYKNKLRNPASPLRRDTRLNFIDSTNPSNTRAFTVEQLLRICSK